MSNKYPKRAGATDSTVDNDRRATIKRLALAGLGVGATAAIVTRSPGASADSHLMRLDEDSGPAQALGYKHDAANVDAEKYPQSQGDNKICASCQLYQAVTNDGWGACPIFAGKLVAANGWCSAWVTCECFLR